MEKKGTDDWEPGTLVGWGTMADGSVDDGNAGGAGDPAFARQADMAQAATTTSATTMIAASRLRVYFAEQRAQTAELPLPELWSGARGAPHDRHAAL